MNIHRQDVQVHPLFPFTTTCFMPVLQYLISLAFAGTGVLHFGSM